MQKFLATGALALIIAAGAPIGLQAQDESASSVGAVLQGLDKVTARISTFEAPFDVPVRFGSLLIQ
ncbi:MAG: DUF2155 domain-containing protein, partial [Rhodospirillaceae bacterium]|nr:DUF2155 domain-containing protein [Rhodospirillaceae bacterium]